MSRMIFVNLPVANLGASITFYEALGFKSNPQFTVTRRRAWCGARQSTSCCSRMKNGARSRLGQFRPQHRARCRLPCPAKVEARSMP